MPTIRTVAPLVGGSLLLLSVIATPVSSAPLDAGDPIRPRSEAAPAATHGGGQIVAGGGVVRSTPRYTLADVDGDGLSDGLQARLASTAASEQIDVIVTMSAPGNATAAQAQVGSFQIRHEYNVIPAFAATMTAAQARALAASANVFRVEEDAIAEVFLESARRDFGVDRAVADFGFTGAGVDVCIIDTGVEAVHEQFVDEATGSYANKVVAFKDFIGDIDGVLQTNPYDDHGHGTHVASITLGDGTGSALAARLRGVAPGARLHAAKVLDLNGSGPNSGIIAAIDWCVAQQVDIANLSLGVAGSSDGKDALSKAVNEAVNAGVAVVVAAGNSGAGPLTIGSPAAADLGVVVGAAADWSADPTDPLEANWHDGGVYPAPFSSRGPTKDGDIKPDVMAPGVGIAAALSDHLGIYAILNGCNNDCYTVKSGTSMAAPFVAGVIALLFDADPGLTPAQAAQLLYSTAQDRSPAPGKDNDTGFGLVDAHAALAQLQLGGVFDPTLFPTVSYGTATVADNGEVWIPIDVDDASAPLAITLTIEGQTKCFVRLGRNCLSAGWSPDLEAQLFDANRQPFLEPNPLYPALDPNPMVARLGTLSTCPAGAVCGAVGRQETLFFAPPTVGRYWVRVFPFDGDPNLGQGGSFTYEVSQGPAVEPVIPLIANAGTDQSLADGDGDGSELVTLDGRGSTGPIAGYEWTADDGSTIASGVTAEVSFAVGTHVVTLTVDDGNGGSSTDSVTITVGTKKKGGGNGGGGGGGGGRPSARGSGSS